MNGDPCQGCNCEKVCRKLIERIETELEFEQAKSQTYKNFAETLEKREWVGLTDEEIGLPAEPIQPSEAILFARVIEALLKEKNL